ncbi:MAG: hypothetical protein IPH88_12995 [Bacteroidales bacterium]|nr:hypothetical protein [Bacteroidales bacterium]
MSRVTHGIYIAIMSLLVATALFLLIQKGYSYYNTGLEERFFHADHSELKPSGSLGHGVGIIGSLFMIFGVLIYMVRKRVRRLGRLGILKHWLEFHIFLCTLGPILVLFHTSFKFGGIVAISFWSMVAVFLSGIIGRFIYIQIPRSIEGRALSLNEIRELKGEMNATIQMAVQVDEESARQIEALTQVGIKRMDENFFVRIIRQYGKERRNLRNVRKLLRDKQVPNDQVKSIIKSVKSEISLNHRIERLTTMQNLFKYWHVAHLPFALVMLVIMIIHVAVTITFGYRWIF